MSDLVTAAERKRLQKQPAWVRDIIARLEAALDAAPAPTHRPDYLGDFL